MQIKQIKKKNNKMSHQYEKCKGNRKALIKRRQIYVKAIKNLINKKEIFINNYGFFEILNIIQLLNLSYVAEI